MPSNLPGEVTAFVGRESELEKLRGLLAGSRVLTLTGPGGSGKTRLALALALAVKNSFPHGVWFIDLPIPPGQYRYAFRIDGATWSVPDGAAVTSDDFGGKSAWLTVSEPRHSVR